MAIIDIRLCNPRHDFKEHVKIIEIYTVKFNVSILNKHKIMGFSMGLNKSVTKLFTILTKCFFSYPNPTSYLQYSKSTPLQHFLSFINIDFWTGVDKYHVFKGK